MYFTNFTIIAVPDWQFLWRYYLGINSVISFFYDNFSIMSTNATVLLSGFYIEQWLVTIVELWVHICQNTVIVIE